MIVNKIKMHNLHKASCNNNKNESGCYSSKASLPALNADKCSFMATPLKIDDAVSIVLKNMLSPNFKEISVPLANPNPEIITSFDRFCLRAKNIEERQMSFIEVQFFKKNSNGAQNVNSINNQDIQKTVGQDWYHELIKNETINKLIEASEK